MKKYDVLNIMARIRIGDIVFTVKDHDALNIGGHLLYDRDDDEITNKYLANVIMFGNNNANYLKLNRYFDAKYLDHVNDKKAIGDGCALLRTLSLAYGIDVAILEQVAEEQWRVDTW